MILRMPDLLGPTELAFVREVVAAGTWADGGLTAGNAARHLKRNQELDRRATQRAADVEALVHKALAARRELSDFALPQRFSRPIVARYLPGMEYGLHVDNPILGSAAGAMRTDVSVTVFLAEPDTYDGGELVLWEGADENRIKLKAGDAVAYTTGTPHRVAPVTRGAREVAICWIQSVVQNPAQRLILSDLHRVHHRLVETAPEDATTALFLQAYYNLVRLWAQP